MNNSSSGTPQVLAVEPSGIPQDLKDRAQWVCWRMKKKNGKDRWEKIPINPMTGRNASTNKPETWGTFTQAWEYYQSRRDRGIKGIGYVFSKDDHILASIWTNAGMPRPDI